jgi:hypothetical protein
VTLGDQRRSDNAPATVSIGDDDSVRHQPTAAMFRRLPAATANSEEAITPSRIRLGRVAQRLVHGRRRAGHSVQDLYSEDVRRRGYRKDPHQQPLPQARRPQPHPSPGVSQRAETALAPRRRGSQTFHRDAFVVEWLPGRKRAWPLRLLRRPRRSKSTEK